MRLAKGFKSDAEGLVYDRLRFLGLTPDNLPDAQIYADQTPPAKWQAESESCVAFTMARIAHLRATLQGLQAVYPSELFIYALARLMEAPEAPLVDSGSMPYFAAQALARVGFCPEDVWPFDESKVNEVPPWDAVKASIGHKLDGWYLIDASGAERCRQMRVALAAGYPVGIALEVTEAFEQFNGAGAFADANGPFVGGHYVSVIGYEPGQFLIRNSWGTSWGSGGDAWLADSYVANDGICSNVVAVSAAEVGP